MSVEEHSNHKRAEGEARQGGLGGRMAAEETLSPLHTSRTLSESFLPMAKMAAPARILESSPTLPLLSCLHTSCAYPSLCSRFGWLNLSRPTGAFSNKISGEERMSRVAPSRAGLGSKPPVKRRSIERIRARSVVSLCKRAVRFERSRSETGI